MAEIKCPNCGEVFQVDENTYDQIAKQVRDVTFEQEVNKRVEELKSKETMENQLKLEMVKAEYQAQAAEQALSLAEKDKTIGELKAEIAGAEADKKLALSEAERAKDLAVVEAKKEGATAIADLTIKVKEMETAAANQLIAFEQEKKSLEEDHNRKVEFLEERVSYYKDFKIKMSTKMIGESLEQYCKNEFELQRMGRFPKAVFEKDNDASSGSKGDFIYREEQDGVELLSVMFDMKNEMDTTEKKHKNEDFLEKLDKDRKTKHCEYAVLVSMLEPENDVYNAGIVDKSYMYDKMYVVRPQFFIPLITLLRNMALRNLADRKELELARSQQRDFTNFEENLESFKTAFGKNYQNAKDKFEDAIKEIDKSISALEKVKKDLLSSSNNLRLANDKAEQLTIKRLTKNAPTVKALLEAPKE